MKHFYFSNGVKSLLHHVPSLSQFENYQTFNKHNITNIDQPISLSHHHTKVLKYFFLHTSQLKTATIIFSDPLSQKIVVFLHS